MPLASLPMYDWPEIAAATDRLWARVRDEIRRGGMDAPDALLRGGDPREAWEAPDLLVGQTCGYPFATTLAVGLIGTPSYAVGATPGRYSSVIVVRAGSTLRSPEALSAATMAVNGRDSQSGYRAPLDLFRKAGLEMPARIVETGAHRRSIRAVAAGRADFAAIDSVAWRLALRHEPAAAALSVVAETDETWGLPLITAAANAGRAAILFGCVERAIAALERPDRDALMIDGLVATTPADYAPLAAAE